MRKLRGWFGDLRLRLFGPGEITPPEGQVQALLACTHRYADGTPSWGPCYRYGPSDSNYYSTCKRCGATARC